MYSLHLLYVCLFLFLNVIWTVSEINLDDDDDDDIVSGHPIQSLFEQVSCYATAQGQSIIVPGNSLFQQLP